MTYTNVFGGNTIYPSDVSYLALALSVDTPLEWPLESSGNEDPAARIIDVDPTASGFSVILPDATLTGAGQTILFNNIDGVFSFFVKDHAGNTLATVAAGTQWQLYLAATTTVAGTWRVFRFGASTATVQPSALAGLGLTVTGSTLSQSLPVTTFSTTGVTVATSNRASAFVWNGTGAGTLNLLTAASAGNNFFVFVRNGGGGDLTIDPSGTETINEAATLVLRPGDSATLITDGVEWYTIGLGQEAVFAFDYTSISVTGGTYTLAGSELNRIAYKFVGTLTSDLYVVVPSTVQQYWINNATSGAFRLFIETSGGTPTQVNQGAKGIYYCDGTNMVLASDPTTLTTPIVINQGGTGAITASGARLNLGITSFADAIVTATTGASVRTTIGAAASGANSDITSLTGLTTALAVTYGGTGAATAANARVNLLPSYSGNANKRLSVNALGTDVEWVSASTGTVTSVAALTLGTTGTDLSSTVANGTTTPVITLNVPTASATNRGALSSTDWSTFNSKAASGANTDITALDQDVTITATGTIAANTLGFRGLPQLTKTASYTLALADAGYHISITTGGVVIPANSSIAFPIGTTIVVFNNSGTAQNISITTDTLRLSGTTTTGTRSLAPYGLVTLAKVASTVWVAAGNVS